jgi:hypothetical protein
MMIEFEQSDVSSLKFERNARDSVDTLELLKGIWQFDSTV